MSGDKRTPEELSAAGKKSRRRGAETERGALKLIGAWIREKLQRRLGQARDSGHDADVGCLILEVKRREKFVGHRWMAQAEAACDRKAGKIPVVVVREDGNAKIDGYVVVIRLDDFMYLAGDSITKPAPTTEDLFA